MSPVAKTGAMLIKKATEVKEITPYSLYTPKAVSHTNPNANIPSGC